MSDIISRQAAIDALDQYYKDKKYITRSRSTLSAICLDIKNIMCSLPPTQPEIIQCKDCKHYRECEIFGKKITLCKRREYDALSVEPDDFCSYAERKEQDDG